MQSSYSALMKNYNFSQDDCKVLQEIAPIAKDNVDNFLERFYQRIMQFEHADKFLSNKKILEKHNKKIAKWYLDLFKGSYSSSYFSNLEVISQTHVHIGLPEHYVNAALHVVRSFMNEMLIKNDRLDALACINKIIDMNLDLLSGVYSTLEHSQMLSTIELIHEALKNNAKNLLVYKQAIADSFSLQINRYECLMRLEDKKGEVISPFIFLPVAKKIGMYEKLSRAMIEKSFMAFYNSDNDFSINLSFEDISNQQTNNFIKQQLRNFPQPHRVIFEIVESEYLEDIRVLQNFINTIKLSGAKIAIDDFGAGFSNYDNISKLNPDILKLDGSLIKNIDSDKKSLTIVENIVNLAQKLQIKTVAEFVHNQAVLQIVQTLGIDYVQGFYIQKPKDVYNS